MFKIRFIFSFLAFYVCFLLFSNTALAISDPREVPNNRMGIHIVDENDLNDVARLVNSSGGDWGYVKLVIEQDDRDIGKWQETLDRMRRLHLIPILRLATKVENGVWIKPETSEINAWVDFLDKLNWVSENRYAVIFNEPNHAKEWGGTLNPEEYALFLKEFSRKLKEKSSNFFILPAGLDASAPNSLETMDEASFLARMVAAEPEILNSIDGWSSHSYPNPGFVGSPSDRGRGTVETFLWEQNLLQTYNKENLPIFILETGWQHSEGREFLTYYPPPETVGSYYEEVLGGVWNTSDVVAVVPFLLNYQSPPFDHFSWKKQGGKEFNEIYTTVRNIPKSKGAPKQKNEVRIISPPPTEMIVSSSYNLQLELENKGQSIFSKDEGWTASFEGLPQNFDLPRIRLGRAEPFEKTSIWVNIKTPNQTGNFSYDLFIKRNEETVVRIPFKFKLVPPPTVFANVRIFPFIKATGENFKFIVYDEKERIIFEKKNIKFEKGNAKIESVYNVIPDKTYRFVLVHPYHLPRQVIVKAPEKVTSVKFPMLLPLDPSNDGKLSLRDIASFFRHPIQTVARLLP
ncbi:MAG: hypothetical protein UU21_C0001G0116 [Candidatus Levybacteria bacterium GW2011_GWA2_40_8]|nr:MAG: hypothetical protein UU21_C0001G0116 [Candidatus Levybacteria bacterium GW2011_GWA2_40_8]